MTINTNFQDEQARYQQNWAAEQDPQSGHHQGTAAPQSTSGPYAATPQIPTFDLAYLSELIQHPLGSTQTNPENPAKKRRRVSVEQSYVTVPNNEYTDLIHDPYAVAAPRTDLGVQASFEQAGLANREYAANYGSMALSNEYASPSQKPAIIAHTQPLHSTQQHTQTPTWSNNRWTQAREYRRKVHEPPQIDPNDDATIAEVEQEAEYWVSELIIAMSNTQNVKDTDSSHARRMFLPENICPLLVEAACREIFTALMDRCRNGFRGPASFNKALKPHKDSEPDKTAICRERIENVVDVLAWNKRVCKDVLYEDWKIRLLVNHPLAYDKEKDSQKGSNDQRRIRLEREREKLRQTEEELKRVREGKQEGG